MNQMKTIMLATFLSLAITIPGLTANFQGIEYSIIEKSNLGTHKCSINIRLENKVTKDFLHKLAKHLKDSEPQKYDRFFIAYLLPGMKPGAGAWATSHFNPELEVLILGTTIEEEKALRQTPKPLSDGLIGEWLDESPFIGAKYTLLKRGGKILMLRKFKDGSGREIEMVEKKAGQLFSV